MATILLIIIYICYIGLGIPDSLLGAAWPAIYREFQLPVSCVSMISLLISGGTVVSSIISARVIAKLGTEKVTALSTCLTAVALYGFSHAGNYLWLCLCAIPLGIGAGAIDNALNNYVALHYNAMQMCFLHCFYGIGVSFSPFLMSLALSESMNWRKGYHTMFLVQFAIAVLAVISLPLWKKISSDKEETEAQVRILSFIEMLKNKKIRASCEVFVGISAIESACLVWGSTFLVNTKGFPADMAAKMVTFYFVGMAVGRMLSGLLTVRFSGWQIIQTGHVILCAAVILLLIPGNPMIAVLGLFLIGLGNGPIFPNMTYLVPQMFGESISQSVIGMQMTCSYISIMLTPVLFGMLAEQIGTGCFAPFLTLMYIFMVCTTKIAKSEK